MQNIRFRLGARAAFRLGGRVPKACFFALAITLGVFLSDGYCQWTSGNKSFFGTSYESYDSNLNYTSSSRSAPISRVWYTGTRGYLTEVYYPRIDTAQTRSSFFVVTDGKTFFWNEREQDLYPNGVAKVEWLTPGVPVYSITIPDSQGRFVLRKWVFSHPDTHAIYVKVGLEAKVPNLKLYFIHLPAAGNTPLQDRGQVWRTKDTTQLGAWEGNQYQAWTGIRGFSHAEIGLVDDEKNPFLFLKEKLSLPSELNTSASVAPLPTGENTESNVPQSDPSGDEKRILPRKQEPLVGQIIFAAKIDIAQQVGTQLELLNLSFGESAESVQSQGVALSNDREFKFALNQFSSQWLDYLSGLISLDEEAVLNPSLFRNSVSLIKSMEDKTYSGAFVASPTIPWGHLWADKSIIPPEQRQGANQTGGYHLVWPRDLYQMATSFLAVGDPASAVASLNYLKKIQYSPASGNWNFGFRHRSKDGSFPQNVWVDGKEYWGGLQLDQTALPILLAYRLWREGYIVRSYYSGMVYRAADFIGQFGPWSQQERWEESMGASPSTLAAEIAALIAASEWARAEGDTGRANWYYSIAAHWSGKPNDYLELWTMTQTGPLGNGRYFQRVEGAATFEQAWNPNDSTIFSIANGGGNHQERAIIDQGFLELVRLGVRSALFPSIVESLPEVDSTIRVNLPNRGPGFYRYNGDRYNYDEYTGQQTAGMLWPLLTGERGHYEISAAQERNESNQRIEEIANYYLNFIETSAGMSGMIPEQVWASGPRVGQSTGAATPLGWAHGEYLKLLRSKREHRSIDTIQDIANLGRKLHPAQRSVGN